MGQGLLASAPAHVFVLAAIASIPVASVLAVYWAPPSDGSCRGGRRQTEIAPGPAAPVPYGPCGIGEGALSYMWSLAPAMAGVPAVYDPAVGMPSSRPWRRIVSRGAFEVEDNRVLNAELFACWRRQAEIALVRG